jgi:hypothetical protein
MARRYVLHLPPVQHMNGKLAPSSLVCHNQPDTSETENTFYYGYRYAAKTDVSRYALRDKARNLSEHPYTPGEDAVKALFEQCVQTAIVLLNNPSERAKIHTAFRHQKRYIRLYNYTIAELVRHKGVPPW